MVEACWSFRLFSSPCSYSRLLVMDLSRGGAAGAEGGADCATNVVTAVPMDCDATEVAAVEAGPCEGPDVVVESLDLFKEGAIESECDKPSPIAVPGSGES